MSEPHFGRPAPSHGWQNWNQGKLSPRGACAPQQPSTVLPALAGAYLWQLETGKEGDPVRAAVCWKNGGTLDALLCRLCVVFQIFAKSQISNATLKNFAARHFFFPVLKKIKKFHLPPSPCAGTQPTREQPVIDQREREGRGRERERMSLFGRADPNANILALRRPPSSRARANDRLGTRRRAVGARRTPRRGHRRTGSGGNGGGNGGGGGQGTDGGGGAMVDASGEGSSSDGGLDGVRLRVMDSDDTSSHGDDTALIRRGAISSCPGGWRFEVTWLGSIR